MNNLYQHPMFDHTSYNESFYKQAIESPNRIDWSLPIVHLLYCSGCSTAHLARFLNYSRDHIEGVKIGKINKPKRELVKPLAELICMYVPKDKLSA